MVLLDLYTACLHNSVCLGSDLLLRALLLARRGMLATDSAKAWVTWNSYHHANLVPSYFLLHRFHRRLSTSALFTCTIIVITV